MKTSLILLFACISVVAATNQFNITEIPCESGGCCNLLFKRVLYVHPPCFHQNVSHAPLHAFFLF